MKSRSGDMPRLVVTTTPPTPRVGSGDELRRRLRAAAPGSHGGRVPLLTATQADTLVTTPGVPVVVGFGAAWCGPCLEMAPVLESAADRLTDRARVVRVSVDDSPEFAHTHGVVSVPTILMFRDGLPVSRLVGTQPALVLLSALENALGD